MPNVIVTPHSAGTTPLAAERAAQVFCQNLRLLTALLIAATAIASWGMGLLSPWFVLAPMGGLLGLTVALDRVERAQAEAVRAQGYYRLGLARLTGDWQGQGNPGENFRQADHLFQTLLHQAFAIEV